MPYRAMVSDLAATLSEELIAGRDADALHEIIDRVVVHWDGAANGHRLEVSGNLLEILRQSAPRESDAVSGAILAEVGCGRGQPAMSNQTKLYGPLVPMPFVEMPQNS